MASVSKFEELLIWQLARNICKRVYPLTMVEPISKEFRLADQIKGSSGSIMDNIAEGFDRGSRLKFINSLSIARDEVGELKSQLYRHWIIILFQNRYLMNFIFK